MRFIVEVRLRDAVLDQQGKAISTALEQLGFSDLIAARQGKLFDIEVACDDEAQGRDRVAAMCKSLLVNPVMEVSRIYRAQG